MWHDRLLKKREEAIELLYKFDPLIRNEINSKPSERLQNRGLLQIGFSHFNGKFAISHYQYFFLFFIISAVDFCLVSQNVMNIIA